jgi:predicted NBD/HSP70 family sugar kinase
MDSAKNNQVNGEGARKTERKNLIRFNVWKDGPLSRGHLADALNLNLPTVSNCVAELLTSSDVVEEGYATSTGGRKPQLLDINPSRGSVIGLTFSSRGISSAWANFKGTLFNPKIYPFVPSEGKTKAIENLVVAIRDQVQNLENSEGSGPLVQVGIGISGLVNPSAGISIGFPRFEEWMDVPLREIVEKQFGVPVVIDSHIAAIALAETIFGKYRGFRNALYVQLGPGLGLGIVINGEIYRGSKLNVGEFGHTTITENGPICYCGNYGCLESIASDYALVQQAEAAIKEGVSTHIPDYTPQPGKITPGSIFRAAKEGDRFASNLLERVGRLLGTGIANLVNLFGPEVIILGGTMAEAGDLLLNPICSTLRTKALDRMEKGVEIKTTSFGTDEALKGATTLALYQYLTRDLNTVDQLRRVAEVA